MTWFLYRERWAISWTKDHGPRFARLTTIGGKRFTPRCRRKNPVDIEINGHTLLGDLLQVVDQYGYWRVADYKNGSCMHHVRMWEAYHGKTNPPGTQIAHKDNDRHHNHPSNLIAVPAKVNAAHKKIHQAGGIVEEATSEPSKQSHRPAQMLLPFK